MATHNYFARIYPPIFGSLTLITPPPEIIFAIEPKRVEVIHRPIPHIPIQVDPACFLDGVSA